MKIRVEWSDLDIKPGVIVAPTNGAKERWMLGYKHPDKDGTADLNIEYTINSLADGVVMIFKSKSGLATFLNEAGFVPDYMIKE